jgi:hypothetical protein
MLMKQRFVLSALAVLTILFATTIPAFAQATRTWVSGVGDDANPCSRTAPCKTFAGAISKTAPSGEINVLDPGGFGAVTITKSITISSEGFEAGVLVSGTNGIIVNAAATDSIILRGLDIEGLGTGLAGIKVLSAGKVHVEKCTIHNFTQKAIDFEPSSATAGSKSQIYVSDTIIRDNLGLSSGGILIKPGSNVSVTGAITDTQLRDNQFGLRVEDNSNVTAKSSVAAGNGGAGFIAVSSGAVAVLNVDSCITTNNGFGLKADNGQATIRFANCTIAGNATGISSGNTGLGNGNTVTFTGSNNNADTATSTITGSIARQ